MGWGSLDPRELRRRQKLEKARRAVTAVTPSGQVGEQLSFREEPDSALQGELDPLPHALTLLAGSVEVRGLYVHRVAPRRFTVNLRVTLLGGQKAYRYGYIRDLSELPALIVHWLEVGYWTPDRQAE